MPAAVADDLAKKDKLKAAYLLNFTMYISRPHEKLEDSPSSVHICLQDQTPFESFFKSLVTNRNLYGSKSEVFVHGLSESSHCDITYLHRVLGERDPAIDYGLIVLASDDIPEPGATIVFFVADRKLRFEIDADQAAEKGAVVSSELLKLVRTK